MIALILCNTYVNYHVHKRRPSFPIVSQINLIHASFYFLTSVLIIWYHVSLGLSNFLFYSSIRANILYASSFPHTCHMLWPFFPSWYRNTDNICWEVRFMKMTNMQSLLLLCCLVPLQLKYLPHYPIPKRPHSLFLPQCDRSSFRPIQNRRQIQCISH